MKQLIAAIRVVAGLDEDDAEPELPPLEEQVNGWDEALAINGVGEEANAAH